MAETEITLQSTENNLSFHSGIDIFSGVLTHPIATLEALATPDPSSAQMPMIIGAALIVFLSGLAESVGNISAPLYARDLILKALSSTFSLTFFWFTIALFLRLLATTLNQKTTMMRCFIVCGWAFLPLLFKGVAYCFSEFTVFGAVLSLSIAVWYFLLEIFAFDAILQLGRFKTVSIILILPPCLFFAYFFSLIFAGALISESLF